MDLDFETFQLKLLMSLKQTSPLDENLRTIISTILYKLKVYCGANIASHVLIDFVNKNFHATVVGNCSSSREAIIDELYRRNNKSRGKESIPRTLLPNYKKINNINLSVINQLEQKFDPSKSIRIERISNEFIILFENLFILFKNEFNSFLIKKTDSIIIIPLGFDDFRNLGVILLWTPGEILYEWLNRAKNYDRLLTIRKSLEQLLVTILVNFYRMEPYHYLPSYYQVEQKYVVLLCAEIRDFSEISETLRRRADFEGSEAANCIRLLINTFAERFSEVIEQFDGRVDQISGNSIIAVFGENLLNVETKANIACMNAIQAASELVDIMELSFKKWTENDFNMEQYLSENAEEININPGVAIAIDYGKVFFDYIGSKKNQTYMAIGEHVDFVKNLVKFANKKSYIERNLFHRENSLEKMYEPYLDAPILISRSAFLKSKNVIIDKDGDVKGTVKKSKRVTIFKKRYEIYEIWPDNVIRKSN